MDPFCRIRSSKSGSAFAPFNILFSFYVPPPSCVSSHKRSDNRTRRLGRSGVVSFVLTLAYMSFKVGIITSQNWEAITAADTVQLVSTDLVIRDASRAKIMIRPQCKQYVKKQRSLKRTLACFTSLGEAVTPGSPIAFDPSSSISSSSSQMSQEENRDNRSSVAKTDEASGEASFKRSGRSRNTTPKVVSGRIEKGRSGPSLAPSQSRKKLICSPPSLLRLHNTTAPAPIPHGAHGADCWLLQITFARSSLLVSSV